MATPIDILKERYASLRKDLDEVCRAPRRPSLPSPVESSISVVEFERKPTTTIKSILPMDEAKLSALKHENQFLKDRIQQADVLIQNKDDDLNNFRNSARLCIDELKHENKQMSEKLEHLKDQIKEYSTFEEQRAKLLQDVANIEKSGQAVRDALRESDDAHIHTQSCHRLALEQLERQQAQIIQQQAQIKDLQHSLFQAQEREAQQSAAASSVLKAKEAAFCQAQLKRVQARMAEQERDLLDLSRNHASLSTALRVQDSSATKKEELLVAAMEAHARLESTLKRELLRRDAADRIANSGAALERPDAGATDALAQKHIQLPPAHNSQQLCPHCHESDYGMMTLCQNEHCGRKYHAHCFAAAGACIACTGTMCATGHIIPLPSENIQE